jgi:protein TonB
VHGGVIGGVLGGDPSAKGPFWPGGEVTGPQVLERVRPVYPTAARNVRLEGAVKLRAVILRDGAIGEIEVLEGLGLGCTQAAIQALRRWRFRPGERNGIPVDAYFELTVDFTMN